MKSISMAVEQFGALREAVGPDIHICTDVHTRLDPTYSIQLCRQLEEFKPFFVEDAVRSENPASYKNIRRQTNVPLAAGEHWWSKWPFREVIEDESIDYCRIDLCIVGGITETLKITHWAEAHYIDIVPHNPLGPVSTAACVSVCMASTNIGVQEMPRRPGTFATDLFPQQIEWEDGYAWCPDTPGMGVDFDIEVAEQRLSDPRGLVPPPPPSGWGVYEQLKLNLPNTHPSIHNHVRTSHIRSIVRRQERYYGRNLPRLSHPLHQRILAEVDVGLLTV